MRELFIDLETFSPVNLAKSGVYPYAEHDDFELLLFGYSIDGSPVEVVDLANGDPLPDKVLAALVDPHVVKWAFNAAFERICLLGLAGQTASAAHGRPQVSGPCPVALHHGLVRLPGIADESGAGCHRP